MTALVTRRDFTPRLRRRVILAFAGGIAVTALVLAAAAYIVAEANSEEAALDSALEQSQFNLLLADAMLPDSPGEGDYTDLLQSLRIRGAFETLVVTGRQTYVSGPQVAPSLVSEELSERVEAGRLAYQAVTMEDEPALVVGGRVVGEELQLYFFYPQGERIQGLYRLRNILLAGGIVFAGLGLVVGAALANRILRPVAAASAAATRMSHGELDTRLPEGADEFGALAASFNRMAENLQTKIKDLETAQARERRFVADAAHELRTPVAALVGEASLLKSQLDSYEAENLPTGLRRTANLVVRDIGRLHTLIDDLLEMSRIDSRSAEIIEEEIDLRSFLSDYLSEMGERGAWKRDHVRLHAPRSPVAPIHTDPRRLERILGNLIENALVHGAAPVDLGIESPTDQSENGGGTATGKAPEVVRVTVADHGAGIPEKHLPHIFDRFFKGDPSRSSGPGSGLGLAIARENAQLLGGSIEAANTPGGGARFTLSLPSSGRGVA